MSKDKHRNSEDRQLVLNSINAPGGSYEVQQELSIRRGRVDVYYLRSPKRRCMAHYAPRLDTLGHDPYQLYAKLLRQLEKRGLVSRYRFSPWSCRGQGKKSSKRKITSFRVVANPPQPGKARNERRGQSKPGCRR